MTEGGQRVDLTQEVQLEGSPAALFVKRVLEREAAHLAIEDWSTSAMSLADIAPPIMRVTAGDRDQGLFERNGALVHLGLYGGHVYASVADADRQKLGDTFEWLRERLPPADPSSKHEVSVTFWTYGPHGPQPSWRSIAVPGWDDIRDNYAAAARADLEHLMSGFQPARGGQLLLWHGLAGTGKTFSLRALAWEWREWCEFHYIVDPDTFFGQHADYLMNVLLQPSYQGGFASGYAEIHAGLAGSHLMDDADERAANRWKLLMLEDTGELLTADARAVIGQGLSRFLNVVDGLIGQGLRVLVLVTTNEEIRRLHPAVARPGRCAANVEFVALSVQEASAWLQRHGVQAEIRAPTTLASLYALADGLDARDGHVATGFAG